jgi:small-conductance mechanosensitive channel/CRP-like cAMP-binding protein
MTPMYYLLAQASAPASAPAAASGFAWGKWVPNTADILHGGLVCAGIFVIGMLALFVVRSLLRRHRLLGAMVTGIVAVALFGGLLALNHRQMLDPVDPVAFWIIRIFAAVIIFVLLRLIDRGIIVPVMTRGGHIALPRFIHQIVNILLALFAILIYGSVAFGWDIDKFLAGSAVVSIVLGLALQESLGNFFSGLVMQASPPFSIGHRISCANYEGDVVDMTWRAVTLHTDDDNYIILPNATVAKSEIVNYNVPSRATAKYVEVGLEYDLPPEDAIAVLKTAAMETPGVIARPEPVIYLLNFGDSAIVYQVKIWIEDAGEHEIITHHLRKHIWYRLREKNFNIPFPTRTVEHSSHAAKGRARQTEARGRRVEAIDQVPLLAVLSGEQKRQLADSASEVYLAAGQVLFRQGDAGDSFYILYKGRVEVLVTPEGGGEERVVATLNPGDFFGEMSALTGQPRTATIRAASPLTCIEIEKRDLLGIFEADRGIMEKVSEVVARRNAEREAVRKHPGSKPEREAVLKEQKSLLVRMARFFRLGNAA